MAIKNNIKISVTNPKKGKILFAIDWYLPGYKAGGPIRSMANMAEHLEDKFDIYIVTRNADYMSSEQYGSIKTGEWNKLARGERVFYIDDTIISYNFFKNFFKIFFFDIIYIHGIYSWKFSILPLIVARLTKQKKIIVAPRGMLAPSAINIKGIRKKIFLKLAKTFRLYNNIIFHATNNKEKKEIYSAISRKSIITVIENLPRKIANEFMPSAKKQGVLRLVALTRVSPEKNILYAIEILSKLQDKNFFIEYDIYGQIYNYNYWRTCEKMIKLLPPNINVKYKGVIKPDDIYNVIPNYHCLFLPTKGENFGHAVLEVLMAGRPVIISDKTPWRNLREKNIGVDIDLKNTDEFIKTLIMFANMDSKEFNIWTKKAFDFAREYCESTDIINKYKYMFE